MKMDCMFKATCKMYGMAGCNPFCYPYVALYGTDGKSKPAGRPTDSAKIQVSKRAYDQNQGEVVNLG